MMKFKNHVIVLGMLVLILKSDMVTDHSDEMNQDLRKRCTGYTILEFGKAIDCNADTIRLDRRYGIQASVIH